MSRDPGNLNFRWAHAVVHYLSRYGLQNACISPGSRNTPLTLAFVNHSEIETSSHIDERSCGFFGLGLAKRSHRPVALTCTSGTAAANFFPAIIEANASNIPLVVCTADRPPHLHGIGANQTIDQQDLYGNKVRLSLDMGLPENSSSAWNRLYKQLQQIIPHLKGEQPGPIHLNFPFGKPLEPEDPHNLPKVAEILSRADPLPAESTKKITCTEKEISGVTEHIRSARKGLIMAGPMVYDRKFVSRCFQLADRTGYPLLADGISQLRFGNYHAGQLCCHASSFLQSEVFTKANTPELILRFGRMPTNREPREYLTAHAGVPQILVSGDGIKHDSTRTLSRWIKSDPADFLQRLLTHLNKGEDIQPDPEWSSLFKRAEQISAEIIHGETGGHGDFEGRIYPEVLRRIPPNTNLMVSNSMPVRDLDYYAPHVKVQIPVYFNRGVSGIDGITSTALGITRAFYEPMVLITGDLAFIHDSPGILSAAHYDLPITVVLINNSGGGIFEMLPVSQYPDRFKDYITTPHQVKFEDLTRAFRGQFTNITTWDQFEAVFQRAVLSREFHVLQFRTNARDSQHLREQIRTKVLDAIVGEFS